MATESNLPPPASPRVGDDATPPKQKGSTLVIRTPALEPTKRSRIEDAEAIKRKRALEELASQKQAELEEILLQLSQEKGKDVAPSDLSESDSEDPFDPIYREEDSDDEEEVTAQVARVASRKTTQAQTLKSGPRSKAEERGVKGQKREKLVREKAPKAKKRVEFESSSSEEEQTSSKVKESTKRIEVERPLYQVWEDPAQSTRLMARRALGRISASPFTAEVCEAEPPKKFQTPRFTVYDGKSDPLAHYRHYMQAMTLWSWNNELMCRVFPSSLGDTALQWFHKLPPASISRWEQLAEEFVARFLANTKQPKTADVLLTMKKKAGESLRGYSRRYMELYNEVEGCSEQLAVTSFKLGLQKEDKLWLSLTKKPAINMSDLMCRIEKYAKVEDEIRPAEQKEIRSSASKKGKEKPGKIGPMEGNRAVYQAINTVFKEPIFRILPLIKDKPYFRWPGKLPDYEGKAEHKDYCAYHRDRGHMTGYCRSLRHHLEELVRDGHLAEFIADQRPAAQPPQQGDQRRRGRDEE